MGIGATFGSAVAGWFAGSLAFLAIVRWAALILVARNQVRLAYGEHAPWKRVIVLFVCQSFFHSGPWLVLTLGFIAYEVRSEPWAPWLELGFAASFIYLAALSGFAALRIVKRSNSVARRNAA